MILTFMRHPPIDAAGERCIGQTDVELSPEGQTALLALAEHACRQPPDRILCSDLKRCRLLAEAIAARLGCRAEPDPIWREVSFGRWENRTWSDIKAKEPRVLSDWLADFEKVVPPGGESFQQLQARVINAVSSRLIGSRSCRAVAESPPNRCFSSWSPNAQERFRKRRVLVVTHAGVIRAAVSAFSNLPLRRAFEFAVPYGAQSSFFWDGNSWSLVDIAGVPKTP
jgi:broad specificity phosphatase PhoE